MSMDAGSNRFAIAALLDGRMGIVTVLIAGSPRTAPATQWEAAGELSAVSPVEAPITSLGPGDSVESSVGRRSTDRSSTFTSQLYPADYRAAVSDTNSVHEDATTETVHDFPGRAKQRLSSWKAELQLARSKPSSFNTEQTSSPDSWHNETASEGSNVPVYRGHGSLYRHLCSDDDPPRTVAICPSRSCVAFGCAAGVELHWIDALTGQNLNRWFPLAAPSDHLYFLPPRGGRDRPTKLRLVSSAAHPGQERPAVGRRFEKKASGIGGFWSRIGSNEAAAGPSRGAVAHGAPEIDHCRAVPLSDGYHLLFTDPAINLLCLGSDAPLGGPNKLLRKMMFIPPSQCTFGILCDNAEEAELELANAPTPSLYKAAADLSQGVRIVVGYGEHIVLYSVPPDTFLQAVAEQEYKDLSTGSDTEASSTLPPGELPYFEAGHRNLEWVPWRPDRSNSHVTSQAMCHWPLKIRGTHIGSLPGLVELSISSSPRNDLTIWSFGIGGDAVTWQVDDGIRPRRVTNRTIARDGTVGAADERDADGDVFMSGADGGAVGAASDHAEQLCGFGVLRDSIPFAQDLPDPDGPAANIDRDSDVIMADTCPSLQSEETVCKRPCAFKSADLP
ncbi:hypothetical protein LTR66_000274 [Elasticomyces elasticus]|nr:hypothetical protein LTR66_000274 [Elasticomyces elasticus]